MSTPTPISELVIRQREQRTTERPGIELLDTPLPELEARIARGVAAEVHHLLIDLDPDSPVLPGCIPMCPPKSEETTS